MTEELETDTRRHDTLDPGSNTHLVNEAAATTTVAAAASPCPLDKLTYISAVQWCEPAVLVGSVGRDVYHSVHG